MAFCKYVPAEYLTRQDLWNLLSYLNYSDKNPIVMHNLNSNDFNQLEYIVERWIYAHLLYHKMGNRTLCYQYILSFDPIKEKKYLEIRRNYLLLDQVIKIPIFNDLFIVAAAHCNESGFIQHIHIVVDSVYHAYGNSTFIDMDKLKENLGEMLSMYGMALSGYSFKSIDGKLRYGNRPPRDLYEDDWEMF